MTTDYRFLARSNLQSLINNLISGGYACIGPQVRDGTIVYDEITSVDQLPLGVHDNQSPGSYTLTNDNSDTYFAWANGPQAIKPLLFRPREKLWQSQQATDGQLSFKSNTPEPGPTAILGARACDIAAMKLQDQHFLQQQYVDPYYQARREQLLVVAVNCSHPADTCFCHSTGDGPFADDGYDIALTELQTGFLIDTRSEPGEKIIRNLPLQPCTAEHLHEAELIASQASKQQRQLPETDIKTQLLNQLDSPSWQEIAETCLSCGNCTSVCPSCFCHSEHDVAELDGKISSHLREWDSCFTQGHSYIHGVVIRGDTTQRYRQWLTHKFATWHQQYGRSGCVGCGRCISWCPVGIDVIESVKRLTGEK